MAETTRKFHDGSNSKTSPSRSSTTESVLQSSFGSKVSVHLANPNLEPLNGLLYTACAKTGLIVVATGDLPSPIYHVVPISSISFFTVVSSPSGPSDLLTPARINTSVLVAKANLALTKAKENAAKINKNVDRATQDLFGAFDKQFSARWQGKDIVVMERVVVKAPGYRSEDCKVITKDGEGLLGRVKKVLENERRRAAQKDGGRAVKPAVPNITPAIPVHQQIRKGG